MSKFIKNNKNILRIFHTFEDDLIALTNRSQNISKPSKTIIRFRKPGSSLTSKFPSYCEDDDISRRCEAYFLQIGVQDENSPGWFN